jgi:hypothetical protein
MPPSEPRRVRVGVHCDKTQGVSEESRRHTDRDGYTHGQTDESPNLVWIVVSVPNKVFTGWPSTIELGFDVSIRP